MLLIFTIQLNFLHEHFSTRLIGNIQNSPISGSLIRIKLRNE